jgi:hypothetical protein
VGARRLEIERGAKAVQESVVGLLLDAHRAVALHVRVAAHRHQARAGRPMLPRSIITFDSIWIVRTDSLCCVSPMPQQAIVRSLWT